MACMPQVMAGPWGSVLPPPGDDCDDEEHDDDHDDDDDEYDNVRWIVTFSAQAETRGHTRCT